MPRLTMTRPGSGNASRAARKGTSGSSQSRRIPSTRPVEGSCWRQAENRRPSSPPLSESVMRSKLIGPLRLYREGKRKGSASVSIGARGHIEAKSEQFAAVSSPSEPVRTARLRQHRRGVDHKRWLEDEFAARLSLSPHSNIAVVRADGLAAALCSLPRYSRALLKL